MKLGLLVDTWELFKQTVQRELSPQVSYKFKKVASRLLEDMKYYEEENNKLLEKYGKRGEKEYDFETPENKEAYNKAYNELVDTELEPFKQISLRDFLHSLDKKGLTIAPAVLVTLDWLFKDDVDDEEVSKKKDEPKENNSSTPQDKGAEK